MTQSEIFEEWDKAVQQCITTNEKVITNIKPPLIKEPFEGTLDLSGIIIDVGESEKNGFITIKPDS